MTTAVGNAPRRSTATIVVAIVATLVAAAIAVGVHRRWSTERATPAGVERGVIDAIVARHRDAVATRLSAHWLRIATGSGIYVDLRLAPTLARCASRPADCGGAIDALADGFDAAVASTVRPDVRLLRAAVVVEPTSGATYGFVAEPLVGALELRYVLESGDATTFVTQTIAARLGLDRDGLRRAAIANVEHDGPPRIEPVAPDAPTVKRAPGPRDEAAALLSPTRMRALAALVGSSRLVWALPERGVLWLAADDARGAQALDALLDRAAVDTFDPRRIGRFRYDAATSTVGERTR